MLSQGIAVEGDRAERVFHVTSEVHEIGGDEDMLSDASELLALEDELRACDKRRRDFSALLNLVAEYHVDAQFPELPAFLFAEMNRASQRHADLLREATRPPRREVDYEVSVADAAEALGVSEQTIRNWDQSGCPFDNKYPGRFSSVVFYQWAQTYRSLRNFRREAKKRAVLMNRNV